jgi:hypothetical protein
LAVGDSVHAADDAAACILLEIQDATEQLGEIEKKDVEVEVEATKIVEKSCRDSNCLPQRRRYKYKLGNFKTSVFLRKYASASQRQINEDLSALSEILKPKIHRLLAPVAEPPNTARDWHMSFIACIVETCPDEGDTDAFGVWLGYVRVL